MLSSLLNSVPIERKIPGYARRLAIVAECLVHGLLAIGGVFLLVRRAQGALTSPASFELLSVTGVILGCWLAVSVWRSWIFPEFTVSISLGVLAATLIASALSIPQSSVFGLFILWSPILAIAVFFSRTKFVGLNSESNALSPADTASAMDHENLDAAAPTFSQTMTRYLDDDGFEVISGKVRCDFEPNERLRNVHIGFCPILDDEPEVFAEIADGPDAEVTVGQVLCTGVRFDVKMQQPATGRSSVLVDFYAKCPNRRNLNA